MKAKTGGNLMLFLRPFIPYIAAVLLLVGIFAVGYIKGDSSCEVKHAKGVSVAIQKGVEKHEKIKKQVMALPDADLNKRLLKWLRE